MGPAVEETIRPVAAASGWRVWGQDAAVASLQRAAVNGPRHAYVLCGPDHIGKRLLAREFALALNCPSAASGVPCRSCSVCKRIERGVHPDVSTFDLNRQTQVDTGKGKNTTLTIDTVRAIGHELALRPSESPWRVLIVDDMESMQEAAQEAFLKTLEEPPASAVLILLTSDIEQLLETVLSRCLVINLPAARTDTITAALRATGLAPDDAAEIAALSYGLPGWAFAAQDRSLLDMRREERDTARAWITADDYTRVVQAIKTADRLTQSRDQVLDALVAVMLEWRQLLYQTLGVTDGTDGNIDEPPAVGSVYTVADLVRAITSVRSCLTALDANVRPRLACESMVLQWPTAR